MSNHQLKEEEVYIEHYSKLCDTIIDVDGLLPHFVQEHVISIDDLDEINAAFPSTKKCRTQKLLTYISGPLKGGNTQGFYALLRIMEQYGNQATQQLAKQIKSATDDGLYKRAVSVDGGNVDNSNSGPNLGNHQVTMTNSMSYLSSAIFKGVLVLLLFSILFVVILAIMELRVLKHQMSMQNDVTIHKHSTCDCNRLEHVVMVSQIRGENCILDHQVIDAVYQTTNTWYLQLLIKSSINHLQVAPAFVSIHNDGRNQNNIVSSKPFFTFEEGHLMRMTVYFNGYGDSENEDVSVFLYLMKGPHDAKLQQSGHYPLRGTFIVELLNPHNNYDHHHKAYLISNDTCIECTKRVMQEGGMAKGYGSNFISKNNLHFYYKDDTLYFRISYNTCYSCVYLQYYTFSVLLVFLFINLIDSFFIFLLLVFIEFCRGLMKTSKLIFGLSVDYDLIKQFLVANATKKMIIIGIILMADVLNVVIWEFTGLTTYHSADMIRNYISRIFYLSLYYQVVNTFSHENVKSVVISPMFVILIMIISDKTRVVTVFVNIIIMIFNVCFVFCKQLF